MVLPSELTLILSPSSLIKTVSVSSKNIFLSFSTPSSSMSKSSLVILSFMFVTPLFITTSIKVSSKLKSIALRDSSNFSLALKLSENLPSSIFFVICLSIASALLNLAVPISPKIPLIILRVAVA